MDNFVGQFKLLGIKLVVYNVINFIKLVVGQFVLLLFDDVIIMFYEFGYVLYGMFVDEQYLMFFGIVIVCDFVEFFLQFNEYWVIDLKVFVYYVKNYKIGELMLQVLVDKFKKVVSFNKGYDMIELVLVVLLDMGWYMLGVDVFKQDVDVFEVKMFKDDKIDFSYVLLCYCLSYFQYIWGNGYVVGYYVYLWIEMLVDDGFEWFKEYGGLICVNGDCFCVMVFLCGNIEDLEKMYEIWCGKVFSVELMLIDCGLKEVLKGK